MCQIEKVNNNISLDVDECRFQCDSLKQSISNKMRDHLDLDWSLLEEGGFFTYTYLLLAVAVAVAVSLRRTAECCEGIICPLPASQCSTLHPFQVTSQEEEPAFPDMLKWCKKYQ